MIGDITYLLLTACLTVQQVNQTFIVPIKIMVYFTSFLVKIFFSYFKGLFIQQMIKNQSSSHLR